MKRNWKAYAPLRGAACSFSSFLGRLLGLGTTRRDERLSDRASLGHDVRVFAVEFLPCFLGINELALECRYLSLKLRYFASVLRFRLALRRHALRYKIRVTVLHVSYLLGVFSLEFRYGIRIIKNVLRSNGGTHNSKNRPDDGGGGGPSADLDLPERAKSTDGRKAKEYDDGRIDEGELCGSHIIFETNVKTEAIPVTAPERPRASKQLPKQAARTQQSR